MPRSLADGHIKFTLLTAEPDDPRAPTATELNAGIDASCRILASDFSWSAGDSDKVNEKALCTEGNANSLGASNFNGGITPFRYFDAATKNAHATEDAVFAAVKVKGTELWGYARKTAKKSTEAWAADDEIYLGGKVLTDEPQTPSDGGGYIKTRVPLEFQEGYPNIEVAAGA